jgi:branched-chain amino acid transport system permease protein
LVVRERNPRTAAATLTLLLLGGLAVPQVTRDLYVLDLATRLFEDFVLVAGVRLVLSMGQLNLAHVSFAAIGAYSSAALVMKAGAPFWLGFLSGTGAAAVFSIAVGALTLRLSGAYFFLVTFAFQQLVQLFFENFFESWFGGASGLIGVPQPAHITLFGWTLAAGGRFAMYHVALAIWLVTAIILVRLEYSRFGHVAEAIRQHERLAESLGVDCFRYKLTGFVLAGATAGLIGSFLAHYQMLVHPTNFDLNTMLRLIVFVVVGGASTIWGAYAGTVMLAFVSEFLRGLQQFEMLSYGLLLIVAMRFLPDGLAGAIGRLRSASERDAVNALEANA